MTVNACRQLQIEIPLQSTNNRYTPKNSFQVLIEFQLQILTYKLKKGVCEKLILTFFIQKEKLVSYFLKDVLNLHCLKIEIRICTLF